MTDYPMSVPCPRNHCHGQAVFIETEVFPRGDTRPVYECKCGTKVAVHLDELPEFIREFTR
jgi:hypothetical protein